VAQLRTGEADAAGVSLRSTLEPGHNRPDSAINYSVYENEQYPETKKVFTYAGDVIKETVYRQDWDSGEWNDVYYEEDYAFDAYGNKTLIIYRSYFDGELSWAEKDEYAYNPNGTPLYERFYGWEDGGWKLGSDMTYQYDAGGMLTGGTLYSLYTDMGEVTIPLTVSGTPENLEISITINGVIYMKVVLHYDPTAMKLLGREYFEMDEETGELDPEGVEEYTYDTAGRLLTELYYWNDDYADKTEYVYDAAGRKLSVTDSRMESKAGPFTVYGKTEYEYAGDRLARIKWYYSYYEDDSGLVSGPDLREITVFYYGGGTGNGQVTLTEVSVYPNPVADVLTVSGVQAGATLTITGLSGSTVLRKTLTDTQTTLSVSSLPSGIYFVTVRSGRGTAVFKIIKK
jgi:YD repeat-containing protein